MPGYTIIDSPLTYSSSLDEIDAWIEQLEKRLIGDPGDVGLQRGLASARELRKWVEDQAKK